MDNIELKVKKLKNLKNYQGLSDAELQQKAKELIFRDEILNSLTFCTEDKDKELAIRLLESYLSKIALENIKDVELLRQLLDLELVTDQLKRFIKQGQVDHKGSVDGRTMESLRDNSTLILQYKEKLGLLTDVKEENDAVKIIEKLKDRFHKWINQPENRSNYELTCPTCNENILIRRRLDKEKDEVKQHPWFRDGNILFNKQIFKDYNDHKITIEQAARYLDCSPDYITWINKQYPLSEDENIENK